MSKRLAMLEALIQKGSRDAFTLYALALEYGGLDRIEDALRTFTTLREADPGYVPQYLMCGQLLTKAGRREEARGWLEEGIIRARGKGDSHALSELQSALESLRAEDLEE